METLETRGSGVRDSTEKNTEQNWLRECMRCLVGQEETQRKNADSSHAAECASETKYSHVRLSDSITDTSDTGGAVAATPKAVKTAYDKAADNIAATASELREMITQVRDKPIFKTISDGFEYPYAWIDKAKDNIFWVVNTGESAIEQMMVNDEVGYILSEPVYPGEKRLCVITKECVTGVDTEQGSIYVVSEKQLSRISAALNKRITDEETARQEADSALSSTVNTAASQLGERITDEELARADGDSALRQSITELTGAVSAETANRKNADNALQSQLDSIKVQSTAEDLYGKVHTVEVTLPAQIPALYIDENDFGTQMLSGHMPDAVVKIDGEALTLSKDYDPPCVSYDFRFNVQGDAYVTVEVNREDMDYTFKSYTQPREARITDTVIEFPVYHYCNFNYEFKISGGDHYELTYYQSEYSSVNKDESEAQYVISQTTERRTLEDLQTQDKSSFLRAVNELKQSKANPIDIPFKETGSAIWETKDANAEITIPNLYVSKTLILDPETNTHQYVSISEVADDAYTAFLNVTDMENEKLAPPVTVTVGTTSDTGLSRKQWLCDFHCTGTDDHIVIQQAIDALPSCGGKIVLLEGTYNIGGTITINKNNVTLEGMGVGATTLKTSLPSLSSGILINYSNCRVKNLSLQYVSGANTKGISIKPTTGNVAVHNVVENITLDGYNQAIAVNGASSQYNVFNNIAMSGCQQGMAVISAHDSSISHCIFKEIINEGIYLSNASKTTVTDNTFYDCGTGIYSNTGERNQIIGNQIYECGNAIILDAQFSRIANNICHNNDVGIYLQNASYNDVSHNHAYRLEGADTAYTADQYTIYVESGDNNIFAGNLISGKGYVDGSGETSNTWVNNKV